MVAAAGGRRGEGGRGTVLFFVTDLIGLIPATRTGTAHVVPNGTLAQEIRHHIRDAAPAEGNTLQVAELAPKNIGNNTKKGGSCEPPFPIYPTPPLTKTRPKNRVSQPVEAPRSAG